MNLNTNRSEFILSFDDEAQFFHNLLELLISCKADYQLFIKTAHKVSGEVTNYDLETQTERKLFAHTAKVLATGDENIVLDICDRFNRLVLLFDPDLKLINILVSSVDKLIKKDRELLIEGLPIVLMAGGKLAFVFGDDNLNFITFTTFFAAGQDLIQKLRKTNDRRPLSTNHRKLIEEALLSIVKFKTESIACEACEDLALTFVRGSKINHSLISHINAEIDGFCQDTYLSEKYEKELDFFENKVINFYKNYRSILSEGLKRIEEIT